MITKDTVEALAQVAGHPLLTLYTPTHRAGAYDQDKLALKNEIKKADRQLTDWGMPEPERADFLAPLQKLLADQDFWEKLSDTLLILRSRDEVRIFHLPVLIDAFTYLGTHYYLHPTLPVVHGNYRFFLLALSRNEVRFFEGRQFSITPVKINDLVPVNADALRTDQADDARLQSHTGAGGSYKRSVFHGQGSEKDRSDANDRRFLQAVDDGLMTMLHDEAPPMVIAAVEELAVKFQEISAYHAILKQFVAGNPEGRHPADLHEAAWLILSEYFDQYRQEDKERFGAFLAKDEASFSTDHIVRAAAQKRVDTLFVANDAREWGQIDMSQNEVQHFDAFESGATDLIEYAAMHTFLNGGNIYLVPRDHMPRPAGSMNAIYRY